MTAENSDPTKFGYEHRMFNIETNQKPSTTIPTARPT
jgi:hypothetical protein